MSRENDSDYAAMIRCPEIQEKWVPKAGDRLFTKRGKKYAFAGIVINEWLEGPGRFLWNPRMEDLLGMLPEGWLWWELGQNDSGLWHVFLNGPSNAGEVFLAAEIKIALVRAVMFARCGLRWNAERKVWG